MKRIDSKTVELTEAELVVKEWHSALLDAGYGLEDAAESIMDAVPASGETHRVLSRPEFYVWLTS